ncbi:MAG: tRNA 2-thiocytidine(32) synthetase TtcA [Clostridia bacterium]|nr:tRNA 2-thiocytidine(32) synthetase TtcA [Clostridia bacterium]
MQRLLGELRKADQAYGLIQPGDRIMIGVSGGKDSLVLCALLSAYRRFCPAPFSLESVCLKIGEPFDTQQIAAYMHQLDIPFTLVEEDFLPLLQKEKSPCSLCARLRRGILLKKAEELGCNKLALGHHRDDVMETYLMSTVFEGRFYALSPIRQMEKGNIAVIRPLIDMKEGSIAALAQRLQLPVMKNPCPVDGQTKRQEMKDTLRALEQRFPGALDHFQSALQRER